MCFHYSLTQKASVIEELLHVEWNDTVWQPVPHVNGFSFRAMPIITQQDPHNIQILHWGLIPHWIKNLEEAKNIRTKTLNARCETIFEKPSFRNSITTRRCLIPADGFFEWMDVNGKKYPYHITVIEKDIFCFGGIYAQWADSTTGELMDSFSIITTEANELMAKIHNLKKRMPVIIAPDRYDEWLSDHLSNHQMNDFFTPFPTEMMKAEAISIS